MGRLNSLERGVKIWTGAAEALRKRLKDIRRKHRFTWWARRAYWKVEMEHDKTFRQLINYRIKYATAVKESGQ